MPPRFVPTLTTVLDLPEWAIPGGAETAPPAAPSAPSVPPLPSVASRPAAPPARPVTASPRTRLAEVEVFQMEEQLLHRVLQRVDLLLEERVSDAIFASIRFHLDALVPDLRKEIETVLRALVSESLALELSNSGSTPTLGPESLG
jgi:hypothetical protein